MNINTEDSKTIMNKLLEAVNAPEDFNFNQDQWFWKYEWTEEQQTKFTLWLADFLEKKKYCKKGIKKRGQRYALYEAKKMVMNYGWKLKTP